LSAKKNAKQKPVVEDVLEEQIEDEAEVSQAADNAEFSISRLPLIAGNWKMNLDHLQAIAHVQKLAWSLKDVKHDFNEVEVAVLPPFTDLRSVQTLLSADKMSIELGAQDVSPHDLGAYTGDVSAQFLAKLDVRYVTVGHSERRSIHSETDEVVAAKANAATSQGLVPIICVGETADDRAESGAASVPVAQLEAVLSKIPNTAEVVVAYEPVWAIGTGNAATPEQAEEVCLALRNAISNVMGEERAVHTRLLYGGSVTSHNIASFMRQNNIDGALVGSASLDSQEFSRIVQYKKHVTAS